MIEYKLNKILVVYDSFCLFYLLRLKSKYFKQQGHYNINRKVKYCIVNTKFFLCVET